LRRASPIPAHDVIARWSRTFERCTVITQNVDDLHVQAGTANLPARALVLSGSCHAGASAASSRGVTSRFHCKRCRRHVPRAAGLARPGVVWFGESLPIRELDAAAAACDCDVFLTVGTSAVVYPAAGLVHEARHRRAFTAELNLEATPASDAVDVAIQGPANVLLGNIAQRLTP
jgi:NAD-dependent deacetylase